jgi:hypothetical protein
MMKADLIKQAMNNPIVKALMERLSPDERLQAERFAEEVAQIADDAISKSAVIIDNGEMPTKGESDNKGG